MHGVGVFGYIFFASIEVERGEVLGRVHRDRAAVLFGKRLIDGFGFQAVVAFKKIGEIHHVRGEVFFALVYERSFHVKIVQLLYEGVVGFGAHNRGFEVCLVLEAQKEAVRKERVKGF